MENNKKLETDLARAHQTAERTTKAAFGSGLKYKMRSRHGDNGTPSGGKTATKVGQLEEA